MTIQYEPGVLYDWASSDMPAELPLDAEVVLLRRNLPTRITQVYNADWQNVGQFIVLKPAAAPARDPWVRVTDAEIAAACAFYRAGYDTLGAEEQEAVQQQGLSWLRAWDSAYMVEWFRERNKRAAATTPAPNPVAGSSGPDPVAKPTLADALAVKSLEFAVSDVEREMAQDAKDAEHTGERPDLWEYECCIPYGDAAHILAALRQIGGEG